MRLQERCVSHSISRRRRWRTCAATLALTLASLAIPAAALADGQLDPAFNNPLGYHLGTAAEGTVFTNSDNRIPMVVQTDAANAGKIVVGGSRGGLMTLVRYNINGTIDTTFGIGGVATASIGGTPSQTSGNSGATAMTLDAAGNIIAAGYGGSQSMVVVRFTPAGIYNASVVCYAPHLIDYSARAVAVRPNGSVVLVGFARDRHPAFAVPVGPNVTYGQRTTVTLAPAGPATPTNTTACGAYSEVGGLSRGSANVIIDGLGHDGTVADAARGNRSYDGVAALPDNRYIVVSTNGPDANVAAGNAAWIQRFTLTNGTDTTFNTLGAGMITPVQGRVVIPNGNLHAIKLQGTDAYAVGESTDAIAANRRMLVARVDTNGLMVGGFGASGIALARVAGGNNTGQALVFQGGNVIVGGSANLAGKAALGLVRLYATNGAPDPTFGAVGANGQVATSIGTPAINGYITGMALTGNLLAVSGRASDPAGLATIAARYYAVGFPPPPPPLPAASTSGIDQVTSSSARVSGTVNANGTASTWWIEYGTTIGYGATTAPQAIATLNDDTEVSGALTGLAAGTLYHARIVVSSAAGTDPGDDLVFTTLGIPAPVTPAAPAAGGGATTPVTGGGTKPTTTTTAKRKAKAKKRCIVPKVTGKKLNKARTTVYSKGCKVQVKYRKSKKAKNTVLAQSRKAGKKLGYRAVVRLTVATKTTPKKK
jgi:uncharacterized delta-60 repeat protein